MGGTTGTHGGALTHAADGFDAASPHAPVAGAVTPLS